MSWVLLLIMIVGYQCFGLVEELWLKTWGKDYETHNSSNQSTHLHSLGVVHTLSHSFEEHLGEPQRVFGAHHHVAAFFSNVSSVGAMKRERPSANEDPYFYVGVYAAIVFATAVMATLNSTVQVNRGFVDVVWC
jgi:hypothetical protein